jgi:hypothetical protein
MLRRLLILCVAVSVGDSVNAEALRMVINEWNCVSSSKVLKNGGSDTFFGTVNGNGDNWVELAVLADHLDVRGWSITWDNNNGGTLDSGSISFTNSSVWSDLRKGTIIGLREYDPDGAYGPLASDTGYNPFGPSGGDWTIFADIDDSALIVKNHWAVDHNNWKASIKDAVNQIVQDTVGENGAGAVYQTSGGIGNNEVGTLGNGPNVDSTLLSYKVRSTSTFLSPNAGQDFSAIRNEVLVPEPSTAMLLLSSALAMAALGWRRVLRRRA